MYPQLTSASMVLGGAPCKHLSIRDLAVFRVVFLPTLKTAILLIYNRLDDALQKGSDRQQGCLREDLPPSALEGGACEAGGPGPHGGFLLLGMTTSVSGKFRHITYIISTENLRIVNKRFKNRKNFHWKRLFTRFSEKFCILL